MGEHQCTWQAALGGGFGCTSERCKFHRPPAIDGRSGGMIQPMRDPHDQSSPVAAGDAGGGDVERLAAVFECESPTSCAACRRLARTILASSWLADLLQDARAEGAREEAVAVANALRAMSSQKGIGARVLTPGREFAADFLMDRAIELLAGGHVANGDSLPPSGRERLGVPPASAAARAASVGRGGVEGDE